MSDLEIPVFVSSKPEDTQTQRVQPEKILNPRSPKTWTLTPKGMLGNETCAYLIDLLRKRGSNAIVLNENGVLEFGVVERASGG